jgi:serine/threonine protein kinase
MISKATFSTSKDTESMKLETELMKRVVGHPNVVRHLSHVANRDLWLSVSFLCGARVYSCVCIVYHV